MVSQPVARALAKVVEREGFKTVFVLRLAPIIPLLPLGAYSYIYGTSALDALTFASATCLGSIKPYLLDSFLGVFSKQLLDGDALSESQDVLLLVGLGALVLLGTFATQLAGESWDFVQAEVKAEAAARKAAALELAADGIEPHGSADASWAAAFDGAAGWWTDTEVGAEVGETWAGLMSFMDQQWEPARETTLEQRAEQRAERQRLELELEAAEQRHGAAAALLLRARRAVAPKPHLSRDAESAATEPSRVEDEAAGAGNRAGMAAWEARGPQPLRPVLTTILFSFALLDATRRQWGEYPELDGGAEGSAEGSAEGGGAVEI